MNIELTDRDAAVLHGVLTARMGGLSVEIATIDDPVFRTVLCERRDAIARICELLSPTGAER
jgi:hypothetical protein